MRRLALLALFATLLTNQISFAKSPSGGISVVGMGEVSSVPDIGVVTIGASGQARSPKEALQSVDKAVKNILAVATGLGIAERDIQTSQLSLSQDYNPERRGSYVASSMVTVTVRSMDTVGDFIAQAVQEGATNLSGVAFSVADPAPLLVKAREKAFLQAKEKAEQLARLAGVTLGRAKKIEELDGGQNVPMPKYRLMAAQESTSVSAGEIGTNVTVRVDFEVMP